MFIFNNKFNETIPATIKLTAVAGAIGIKFSLRADHDNLSASKPASASALIPITIRNAAVEIFSWFVFMLN